MSAQKTHSIRLRLRELAQLFNSMDPSPFIDRDLDADAEAFIVSWAREMPHEGELEPKIELATPLPADRLAHLESAVRHYFGSRAEMKQREFRHLMRRGRSSLVVGVAFLAGCLLVSELFATLGQGTLATLLKESLTIGGWVAMWRPLEIYLYDWWPLRDERALLQRLSRAQVHVHVVDTANTRIAPPPASAVVLPEVIHADSPSA